MAERRHAAGELGHNDLHAALSRTVPLMSDHRDAHLTRTLAGDDLNNRQDNNLEVGQNASINDVLKIELHHAIKTS